MSNEIAKMLVLSTGHLTEDACNRYLPDNEAHNPWYQKGEYGWFVYVTEDAGSHPRCFEDCLNFARFREADWIMFDCDGPFEAGLTRYEW